MKVNPDKFNAIIFGKNESVNLTFNDITIKSTDEVKLLGIKLISSLRLIHMFPIYVKRQVDR